MGSSKFHTLRRLVSPSKHQPIQDDPNDDMAMVGRSEVPVCLLADRPPAHLLQSLDSRGGRPASASGSSPPLSPRSQRRLSGGSASGSPTTAAPDSPFLTGYRRSPVPEPILEVDERDEEEEEENAPPRPVDAVPAPVAAPPPDDESPVESPGSMQLDDEGGAASSDEALPPLTASPSAASSLAGRSSSESAELREGVPATSLPLTAGEEGAASKAADADVVIASGKEPVYAGL